MTYKTFSHSYIYILLIFLSLGLQNCKISYSLSGASIPPDAKTMSVNYIENRAMLVNPSLSQILTDELKDKLISDTDLEMINGIGDLHFEGEITDYNTKPQDIQSNESAASNRLTITVNIRFTNSKDSKFDFEKKFSRFEDYSSSKSLNEVEDELVESIIDQLILDIFNQAVVNW